MYSVALDKMLALLRRDAGANPSSWSKLMSVTLSSTRSVGTASFNSMNLVLMFVRYFFSILLCEDLLLRLVTPAVAAAAAACFDDGSTDRRLGDTGDVCVRTESDVFDDTLSSRHEYIVFGETSERDEDDFLDLFIMASMWLLLLLLLLLFPIAGRLHLSLRRRGYWSYGPGQGGLGETLTLI